MDEQTEGTDAAGATPRLVFESVPSETVKVSQLGPYQPIAAKKVVVVGRADPPRETIMEVRMPPTETIKMSTVATAAAPENDNLDDVSVEELQRQQEELDRKIREKKAKEKEAIIAQIVHVVGQFQIPVDELVEALGGLKVKRKGVKAVQKYRDPKTGATWSGRGKEPSWIKGSKNRDKFLIK